MAEVLGRRRILIIGPSNIGDAVIASDVVAEVHQHFPDAHVTLLVGERATALFREDPRIHTLVDADAYRSVGQRLRLVFAVWRYQPHRVVDLRHTLYPLLLKPLSAWRYLRQPPRGLVHMRDRHMWKLRRHVPEFHNERLATATLQRPAHPIWIGPRDYAHVETLLRRWQLEPAQRLVVICPGSRSHIKRWSTEGFAHVSDRLIGETHAEVVFAGEPEEKPVVEDVMSTMQHRAHSAVGLTTIRQLAALMQRAQLVITNDSAALHVASALKAPTLALFGPTDAAKYGPTAPHSRTIRRRLFCAPCEQALCRFNHECMRFIAPDEVFDAAVDLLAQAPLANAGVGGDRKRRVGQGRKRRNA
jgi:ADP-heptose:LPS heptosyltransferase